MTNFLLFNNMDNIDIIYMEEEISDIEMFSESESSDELVDVLNEQIQQLEQKVE